MLKTLIENRRKAAPKEEGFTLIEVLVTMAIIAIMIAGVAVAVMPETGKAQVIRAKSDIRDLEKAIMMYNLDMLNFPDQQDGLSALKTMPSGADAARYRKGGYLRALPNDPWGNPYVYIYPGEYGEFDIMSYGADGEPGGEDKNADIVSWEN